MDSCKKWRTAGAQPPMTGILWASPLSSATSLMIELHTRFHLKEWQRHDTNHATSPRSVWNLSFCGRSKGIVTRLLGKSTHFLPFNKGDGFGAGNPDNPNGYKTAY